MSIFRNLIFAVALPLTAAALAASPPFNLGGPEVTKLDWNTRSLKSGDYDGDGLTDLAVANNDAGKIILLLQREPGSISSDKKTVLTRDKWDPLLEDARFEEVPVITGQFVYALAPVDLNGDGKTDLAYTGNNDPLTIHLQSDNGEWTEEWVYENFEPLQWHSSLAVGDVTGDGLNDVVALSKDRILIWKQQEDGGKPEPKAYRLSGEKAYGLLLRDVDKDGRLDIVYLQGGTEHALRIRFQYEEGGFGPEVALPMTLASGMLWPLELPGGDAAYTYVEGEANMVEIFKIRKNDEPSDDKELQPLLYPASATSRGSAIYSLADFDGDERVDLALADPDSAQIFLYRQRDNGLFGEPKAFPSLAKISSMAAGKFGKDGPVTLVVLSADEGIIGTTSLDDNGRLTFPKSLPTTHTPLVATTADTDGDGVDELLILEKDKSRDYHLAVKSRADGEWKEKSTELESLSRDPEALAVHDVNGDGRRDLIITVSRRPAILLTQGENGSFSEAAVDSAIRTSQLDGVSLAQIGSGDIDGDDKPELIVGKGGFARALAMDPEGDLQIVDQFNARSGTAGLSAPLLIDIDLDGDEELLLYEQANGALQILDRDDTGVFRYKRSIKVGAIDLVAAKELEMGSEKIPTILLFGKQQFWVLPLKQGVWEREVITQYETELEDVNYMGSISGDFNSDGVPDIIALDPQTHVIEILEMEEGDPENLKSVLRFTVFEDNPHYRGRRGDSEPREIEIGDFTGDGRADIAALVHDRVLLYFQD